MIEWNISITNENIIIYNNDYFIDNLNSKNYNLIFMNINHKLNYDYTNNKQNCNRYWESLTLPSDCVGASTWEKT